MLVSVFLNSSANWILAICTFDIHLLSISKITFFRRGLLPPFFEVVVADGSQSSRSPHYVRHPVLGLLSPFLATIQAPDENRHWFIRRSGLHLPITRP